MEIWIGFPNHCQNGSFSLRASHFSVWTEYLVFAPILTQSHVLCHPWLKLIYVEIHRVPRNPWIYMVIFIHHHVNSIEVQEMRLNGGPPASIFEGCLQRNHHLGSVRYHRHPAATPFRPNPLSSLCSGAYALRFAQLLSRDSKLFALFPSSDA